MPGIGRVQQAHLAALDIHKVSDLISQRGTLAHLFTAGTVQFYLATALGLGSNQVFILHFNVVFWVLENMNLNLLGPANAKC